MKKWIIIAAMTASPLAAQNTGFAFQKVITSSGEPLTLRTIQGDVIPGRPVSATEERHSLQVLADGTRIETKSSNRYYRDDQGRTRIEREDGTILISDPLLGAGVEMKDGKVVSRSTFSRSSNGAYSFSSSNAGEPTTNKAEAELKMKANMDALKAMAVENAGAAFGDSQVIKVKRKAEAAANKAEHNDTHEEDLGTQAVNGISAQGTRSVTTIPLGMIGNDRPIEIVSERWVSSDLEMTIKSTNKDPRFGETTYELTNILTGAPDPTLFQIPAKQ